MVKPERAGGIGTGRSRTASAADPFHFPVKLVPIAVTRQLLPSDTPTRRCRTKISPFSLGPHSHRAALLPRASAPVLPVQQREDLWPLSFSLLSNPVAPSRTQSHPVAPGQTNLAFSLCPLAFSQIQIAAPACRAGALRRRKRAESGSKPVKAGQSRSNHFQSLDVGQVFQLSPPYIVCYPKPYTTNGVCFCGGHQEIANPQSAIPLNST